MKKLMFMGILCAGLAAQATDVTYTDLEQIKQISGTAAGAVSQAGAASCTVFDEQYQMPRMYFTSRLIYLAELVVVSQDFSKLTFYSPLAKKKSAQMENQPTVELPRQYMEIQTVVAEDGVTIKSVQMNIVEKTEVNMGTPSKPLIVPQYKFVKNCKITVKKGME